MKIFLSVFFGILAAVAVLGLAVLGYNFHQENVKTQDFLRKEPAIEIRAIDTACITYSSTFDHGFPKHLKDLAPPAAGDPDPLHAGLIDDVLASGDRLGYVYTYSVAEIGARGDPVKYTVTATRKDESSDGMNFYSDESEVIRFTLEGRPATASDLPFTSSEQ